MGKTPKVYSSESKISSNPNLPPMKKHNVTKSNGVLSTTNISLKSSRLKF